MKMFNVTVQKMNNSVLFLFVFVFFSLSIFVQTYAQKQLTVLNASFELPDSGKIKGWDGKCSDAAWTGQLENIHGWNTDAVDSADFDSGIEKDGEATNGTYIAFMMGRDTSMYQILTRRVADGDMIELKVDVRNTWQANKFKMELFCMQDETERVSIVSEEKEITGTMTSYSISFNAADKPFAVGWRLGILFDNVSDSSSSWVQIDNVQLLNNDPTIIPLENFSFEQPDSGKIKGWDGPGSGTVFAESDADIPGWESLDPVVDSGIDARGAYDPQDGQYVGFLMGGDVAVHNTTDYTIQTGDEITLRIIAKNVYAADAFHIELYYMDGENMVEFASSDEPLNLDLTWGELTISGSTSATPSSVGKKLGVLLDNVSTTDNSWIDFDNVRVNANHAVDPTAVTKTPSAPSEFALAQNYPNPFNPSTVIRYDLPVNGLVTLKVYNIVGQEVSTLVNGIQKAGMYEAKFNAAGLSSGVYFYTIRAGNYLQTMKMLLLK